MNSIVHSARREVWRLRQSSWDLAMITWVPLLAVALLWWIFSAGVPHDLPIGVQDEDHSALSRQLTRMLDATPGLHVARPVNGSLEAQAALRSTDVYAVVVVPRGISNDVKQGRVGEVTLLHNAQLGTHSGLIQRDVRAAVGTLSAGVELAARAKRGESALAARVSMDPIHTQLVGLFNVAGNYEQFLASALVPALLHILAMTAGAWAVGRELRDGSLRDWLGESGHPVRTAGALLGKLLWPWLSLTLVGLLTLVWFTWGRGWHPLGSVAWVAAALALLVGLSVVSGALLAALTRSLRMALSGVGFFSAPAFAFSGVAYPLLAMSPSARTWALAMPFTHYIALQTGQLQMGAPMASSAGAMAGLLAATVLAFLLSIALLERALTQPGTWGKP
ncbi:ABC transporter permease [Simplicispira suum]|uniref:ABC transporter permease n=1 Tax=Simplicispira suum TaxID=2109915 RepID=A0A2S0MVM9_9BURK|nr:ABC transporter permease [Simplicispira suum]AVO39954.1 ABC transporter permease [Simplicispira suum]